MAHLCIIEDVHVKARRVPVPDLHVLLAREWTRFARPPVSPCALLYAGNAHDVEEEQHAGRGREEVLDLDRSIFITHRPLTKPPTSSLTRVLISESK